MMTAVATGSYSELRDTLGTGDIVLFSGKGLASWTIKRFTRSRWSHVGMVVRTAAGVLMWESTSLQGATGVRLVTLSEAVRDYDGEVSVRALEPILGPREIEILGRLREEFKDRPYEHSLFQMVGAEIDWLPDLSEDLSSLFCSELVAEAYQRLGILPADRPSNEYVPRDFANGGIVERELRSGFVLQPERRIK